MLLVTGLIAAIIPFATAGNGRSPSGETLTRPVFFSIAPNIAYPNYDIATSPGALRIAQGFTASASVTLTSFNSFSAITQCNNTWWGHLVISTQVSPSSSSAPSATVEPSCIRLSPNATSSASLTVTTTPFTQPGYYNILVIAGFTGSPSGWSTGRTSTVLVTVTGNGYAVPVIASLGIMGAVVSVIIVRKRGLASRRREKL